MRVHTSLRMRTRVADDAVRGHLAGKVLGRADYDIILTGPTEVLDPAGRPLCVYLPGVLAEHAANPDVYAVLHSLRTLTTSNRGMASGTRRLRRGHGDALASRSETVPIASTVVGALDPQGQRMYCRLSSWTGRNLPEFETLHPLLRSIAAHLAEQVPARYATQLEHAHRTHPAWVVPGTPFTTVTVNNTYPTGVHTDKGDLDAGFSTLACLRRGEYTGGELVFPQYRVAVGMFDGDLLLMDAHQWHGNTAIVCACQRRLGALCAQCGAERISLVSYFRSAMTACGSPAEEHDRAARTRERVTP